jgi:large subunit ribosomal protein L9
MKKSNTKADIILLKNVNGLGKVGDLVDVRKGYARNWLLPYAYATRATSQAIESRDLLKTQALKEVDKHNAAAQAMASRLDGSIYTLQLRADNKGHLYASIHAQDLLQLINAKEQLISRKEISIPTPIRTIGEHVIVLNLFNQNTCNVTLNIQRVTHF